MLEQCIFFDVAENMILLDSLRRISNAPQMMDSREEYVKVMEAFLEEAHDYGFNYYTGRP